MAEGEAARKVEKKPRLSWRGLLRAVHRDIGHLAVGFTVIYAVSGLAVNHIADWEPSFASYEQSHEMGAPLAGSDDEIARTVSQRLGVTGEARDVYRAGDDALEVVFDKRTLHVNTKTGHVVDEGQRPRFFLRAANWLHLNRGKKAWTIVADIYAAGLLLLAISGIFITPGRKGLWGRGGVLLLLGALVPVVYVQMSGGPDHASREAPRPVEGAAP